MRLLVTRPEPDALKLKARLETMGHEATVEPLLTVSYEGCEDVDLTEAQALIATSRYGLSGLEAQGAHRIAAALPIFVVGQATAQKARALGFSDIVVGGGDAASLVPAIVASADPMGGVLVHLSGADVAANQAEELAQHGFRVTRAIVYRMLAATSFSDDTAGQIESGEIDGVLLFSPRTAAVYARLAVTAGLLAPARRLVHYCLSDAVAARLGRLGAVRCEVAGAPTIDALLDLLS